MNPTYPIAAIVCVGVVASGCAGSLDKAADDAVARERLAVSEREEQARQNEQRLREAEIEAQSRALEIQAEADRIRADASVQLEALRLRSQARIAEIRRDDAASAARLEATLTAIREDFEAARIKHEQQAGVVSGIVNAVASNPIVGGALGSVGVDAGGVGGLATLLLGGSAAYATARYRGRKREDKAWDDAKAESDEAAKRADKAWDEAEAKAKAEADARIASIMAEQAKMMALLIGRAGAVGTDTPKG